VPQSTATHGQCSSPRLLIVVEGRHDVEFLKRIGTILHQEHSELPDLAALERQGVVIFIPAGGNDFRPWLLRLAPFGCAEFHLYDREVPPVSAQREQWAMQVNRQPRCQAFVTRHRSLENYLHPAAIYEARGLNIVFSAMDDVAELAARAVFAPSAELPSWDRLSRRARRRQRDRAKAWLNSAAVERMTAARLVKSDPAGDVVRWLTTITALLQT
jgi:putative ATP-dependent endonuclease of OLD family